MKSEIEKALNGGLACMWWTWFKESEHEGKMRIISKFSALAVACPYGERQEWSFLEDIAWELLHAERMEEYAA